MRFNSVRNPEDIEVYGPEKKLIIGILWRAYQDATGRTGKFSDFLMNGGRIDKRTSALNWLFNLNSDPMDNADYLIAPAGLEATLERVQYAIANNLKMKGKGWAYYADRKLGL